MYYVEQPTLKEKTILDLKIAGLTILLVAFLIAFISIKQIQII